MNFYKRGIGCLYVFFVVIITNHAQSTVLNWDLVCDFLSEDPEGLLWLGTVDGVFTFDGRHLKQKKQFTPWGKNVQSAFFFNKASRSIWYNTYDAIMAADLKKGNISKLQITKEDGSKGLADYHIFYQDTSSGLLWCKQGRAVYSLNVKDSTFNKITTDFGGRRVATVLKGVNNYCFLSYYYTYKPQILYKDEKKIWRSDSWLNWPDKTLPYDLIQLDSDRMLYLTDRGLYIGQISERKIFKVHERNSQQFFLSGLKLNDEQVLLSSELGLFILSWDKMNNSIISIQRYALNEDIPLINRMFKNKAGVVFLSAYKKGLYIVRPDISIFKTQFLFQNQIIAGYANYTSMAVLDEKNEWTYFSIDGNNWSSNLKIIKQQEGRNQVNFFGNSVECLIRKSKAIGLNPYNKLGDQYILNGRKGNTLVKLYCDQGGKKYLTNSLGEIFFWSDTGWVHFEFHNPGKLPINFFQSLNNKYYIAAVNQQHIWLYPKSPLRDSTIGFDFNGAINSSIIDQERKLLWMATSEGLISMSNDESKEGEGLKSYPDLNMSCYCAVKDTRGRIWVSTNNHIVCYDADKDRMKYYTLHHGVLKGLYLKGGCGYFMDGQAYFISTKGIITFYPDKVDWGKDPVGLNISRFAINHHWSHFEDTLRGLDTIVLDYSQNTLTFDVSLIDYSCDPSKNIVYQISCYDGKPVETGQFTQLINYSALPYGFYKINMAATLNDLSDGNVLKSVCIQITAPFWKKPWFVIIMLVSGGILAFQIKDFFHRRELERKDLLLKKQRLQIEKKEWIEKERARIASDMHDDLGSGLTTIKYLAEKTMRSDIADKEKDQILKIAEYSGQLVNNMSELIWAMNSRFDTLSNLLAYIRRYSYEYLDQFGIKLIWDAPENLDELEMAGGRRRCVYLVVKEILHNVVKHSEAQHVTMKVSLDDFCLHFFIEDDGRGFIVDSEVGNGNGLINMKKRMVQAKGRLEIFSSEHGTRVEIELPKNDFLDSIEDREI